MPEPEVGGLESPAPPRGGVAVRFPCFDGFRAIAALTVLVTHVASTSGFNRRSTLGTYTDRLDIGVAIFFVISGFLLYRPFVAARFAESRAPRIGPYFWRRTLRIFPAYWVALTIAIVLAGRGLPDLDVAARWYALVHVYDLNEVGRTLFGPITQSWSLATEIAFYVFLPVYAGLMNRLGGRGPRGRFRIELAGLGVLYLVSVGFRAAVLAAGASDQVNGTLDTWLPAKLDLFALGMFLALVSVWTAHAGRPAPARLDRPIAPAVCWALAALSFWVVATRLGLSRAEIEFTATSQLGRQFLYGVTAFLLLLPGVFGPQDRGLIRRFLRTPVVAGLGLISYGLYLWQNVWVDEYLDFTDSAAFSASFGEMLLAMLVLSVVAATVSYLVIERPVLRLKRLVT